MWFLWILLGPQNGERVERHIWEKVNKKFYRHLMVHNVEFSREIHVWNFRKNDKDPDLFQKLSNTRESCVTYELSACHWSLWSGLCVIGINTANRGLTATAVACWRWSDIVQRRIASWTHCGAIPVHCTDAAAVGWLISIVTTAIPAA